MSEPILAVDYGTSSSSAALVTAGGVELLKEPATGAWSWPSAVCLDGDAVLVGTPAERRKRVRPECFRPEVKRSLGQEAPIVLGDRSFTAVDLVAAVLRALRAEGERILGEPVASAVVTVPASYGPADPRRALMIKAGEAAGFSEVELLMEPVAAAMAPVTGVPFQAGDLVLVYDFGGGTFDAALVRIAADGAHEVLGHGALDDCGGRDIDAAVFGELRSRGGAELSEALTRGPAAPRNRLRFGDVAHQIKHQLSDAVRAEDVFDPVDLPVALDRARLGELVAPLLHRTVACCRDVIRAAGVEEDEVAAVLLTGGTTRMPVVAGTAAALLSLPSRSPKDPDLAVVQGAAGWAARAGERAAGSWPAASGEFPLRWRLTAEPATLLRWTVGVGEPFEAGRPLATVRLPDGSLQRLLADRAGVLTSDGADPGDAVVSGQWLATATAPAPEQAPEQAPEPASSRPASLEGASRGTPEGLSEDGTPAPLRFLAEPGIVFEMTGVQRIVPEPGALGVAHERGVIRVVGFDGAEVARLDHGTVFTPRILCFTQDDDALVSMAGEELRAWETSTGRVRTTIPVHYKDSGVCSPDARLAATESEFGTVRLFDLPSGREIASHAHRKKKDDMYGVTLVFAPDGSTFVSSADAGSPVVWDTTGQRRPRALSKNLEPGFTTFSPDGRYLVTTPRKGAGPPRLWQGDAVVQVFSGERSVLFSPDGALAVTGSERAFVIRETGTWRERHRIACPASETMWNAVFTPDGTAFVCWTRRGALYVCDPVSGTLIHEFRAEVEIPGVVVGANARVLVAWPPGGGGPASVWDLETGVQVSRFTLEKGYGVSVALSGDERRAAIAEPAHNRLSVRALAE
ncbi:Hsp70 family protein [Microbispora sp. ATCC PTA-5024]|uniref:Hsp70 family protein n=1 Tax=Microbispora sp. ATCC PTA-5024 TaxID=316330 RepID=UPI0003DB8499|nr:Hsp70 family protein [Microbispora sp. ATCC PTA-5024]ETK38002.1 hypothetical protein MPTA5024_01250 [Microbispora sp. ATCC PTA-5024]